MAVCALATLASPARAAEIGLSNRPGCLFELHGMIVSGDAERFRQLADQHWAIDWEGRNDNADSALCLDSRGGQFIEGNALAREVHERAIATRVGPGDDCLSACSLVFMAGRVLATEIEGYRRILHVTGNLGFHAPYTDLDPTLTATGAEVNALVVDLTDMIADFIRHSTYRSFGAQRSSVSMGLLEEMLATPKDELFMIDTVERAARWGVDLDGVRPRTRLNTTDLAQFCANQLAWTYDEPSRRLPQGGSPFNEVKIVTKQIPIGSPDFVEMTIMGMANQVCSVQVDSGHEGQVAFCLKDGFTGVSRGTCDDPIDPFPDWVPWWYAMPPDMPLAALQ